MTVGEFFKAEKLSPEMVELLTDDSDYWFKAGRFVIENWNTEIRSLSPKQAAWLTKIQEDLNERRIEGRR